MQTATQAQTTTGPRTKIYSGVRVISFVDLRVPNEGAATTVPPTPEGPACQTCGDHHSMTLAEDNREYNKLAFEDGKWVRVGVAKSEPTGEDDSIRMFCTNCGEYFALPEGLCEE